jgi:hypothetical protein
MDRVGRVRRPVRGCGPTRVDPVAPGLGHRRRPGEGIVARAGVEAVAVQQGPDSNSLLFPAEQGISRRLFAALMRARRYAPRTNAVDRPPLPFQLSESRLACNATGAIRRLWIRISDCELLHAVAPIDVPTASVR